MATVEAEVELLAFTHEVTPLPSVCNTYPFVPEVDGKVMVQVPAVALTVKPTVPEVVPARLSIPVLVPANPRV